jgi:hypothetical protein
MTTHLSRRGVLAGLGAATGAAALGAKAATAGASDDPTGGFGTSSAPSTQSLGAALTPGLEYLILDPTAFFPFDSGDGRLVNASTGASLLVAPGGLLAPIEVPIGSVLKEVVFAYGSPAGAPRLAIWKKPLTSGYAVIPPFDPAGGTLLPPGAAVLTANFAVDETVDGTATYMLLYNTLTATNEFVAGALIGYEPPPEPPQDPAFVPISPVHRVLDTRITGGKLQPNEERVVPLGVPALATAAVANLTVTETEVAGFVAVFPADVAWPGNSSINWSETGQNLANGIITATDAAGAVKIRGGVNPTHVVIDVQGYLL